MEGVKVDVMSVYGPCNERDDRILYHYTTPEGLISILEGGSIRATDVRYLNDDHELSVVVANAKRLIQETGKDDEGKILGILDSWDTEKMNLFVCSFTESEDSPCMWKNYAKGNGGYAIGFYQSELEEAAKNCNFRFSKMQYGDDSIKDKISVRDIIMDFANSKEEQGWKILQLVRDLVELLPTTKTDSWRHEAEWRMYKSYIVEPDSIWPGLPRFRSSANGIVPYFPIPLQNSQGKRIKPAKIWIGPNEYRNQKHATIPVHQLLNRLAIDRPIPHVCVSR